jgi:DNA-binding NarL/FixJ family response regulator
MRLVANGRTNAQIGAELGLHPRTIDRHLAEAYSRLQVRDRAQAVAVALVLGELGRRDIQIPGRQREAA